MLKQSLNLIQVSGKIANKPFVPFVYYDEVIKSQVEDYINFSLCDKYITRYEIDSHNKGIDIASFTDVLENLKNKNNDDSRIQKIDLQDKIIKYQNDIDKNNVIIDIIKDLQSSCTCQKDLDDSLKVLCDFYVIATYCLDGFTVNKNGKYKPHYQKIKGMESLFNSCKAYSEKYRNYEVWDDIRKADFNHLKDLLFIIGERLNGENNGLRLAYTFKSKPKFVNDLVAKATSTFNDFTDKRHTCNIQQFQTTCICTVFRLSESDFNSELSEFTEY